MFSNLENRDKYGGIKLKSLRLFIFQHTFSSDAAYLYGMYNYASIDVIFF